MLFNFSHLDADPDSESELPKLEQFLDLLEEQFPELNELLEKNSDDLTIKLFEKLLEHKKIPITELYHHLLCEGSSLSKLKNEKNITGLEIIAFVTKIIQLHNTRVSNLNSVLIDLGTKTSLSIDDITQWAAMNKRKFISTKPTKQSQIRIATTGNNEFLLVVGEAAPLYFSVSDVKY